MTHKAPVQDDDAEWLRSIAQWGNLKINDERAARLERIASRLSPTPDTGLIEALADVRPFLVRLTKQGEDNIWRPAERHLTTIDTALANAAPAQVERGKRLLDAITNQLLEGETPKALVPSRKARLEMCAEACRAFNQATKGDGL